MPNNNDRSQSRLVVIESTGGGYVSVKAREERRQDNMYWALGAQDELQDVVERHFSKRFQFVAPKQGWRLPDPSSLFKEDAWQLQRFQHLKEELNQVKGELDNFCLKKWHAHTRFMNKAGDVVWRLRASVDPEFITQAWCKLYENVAANDLVPPIVSSTGTFNTLHLCEAPGAFITSLNHYLKQHHPTVKWSWRSTTLNPYYEGNPLNLMINDDRFILHTLEHWRFGADFTGDLMSLQNLDHLATEASQMGDVLLVTADGSIDCQDDPGEQECHVLSLHYCEVVAALTILAPGGSLLLKMFTLYEGQTACLVYLLCCAFHFVTVFKPATSKEGNSEVYFSCRDYIGRDPLRPWLLLLRQHYGPEPKTKALFPKQFIPETFLQQLYSCANLFKEIQVSVISNNIMSFKIRELVDDSRVKTLRHMVADEFFLRYQMQPIDENLRILKNSKLCVFPELLKESKEEAFSHKERCSRATLQPVQLLNILLHRLRDMQLAWPYHHHIHWLQFSGDVGVVRFRSGKAVERVSNSKFCRSGVLKVFGEVCETARNTLSSPGERLAERVQLLLPELDWRTIRVVDCGDMQQCSVMSGQEEAKRRYLLAIVAALCAIDEGNDLLLLDYCLLTQFNVAIVYLLCHAFQQVGFVRPQRRDSALLFRGLRQDAAHCKSIVEGVASKLKGMDESESVLSVLPINRLCGISSYEELVHPGTEEAGANNCSETVGEQFYSCVINMNHMSIAEHVEDIVYHASPC